jgi:CelD/BcsL family acetyltransferase involved in cellulose biosynthesis
MSSQQFTEAGAPTLLPARRERTTVASRAAAATGIAIEIVRDLADIEADWRAFEGTADGTVFQTFDWLATWQGHVGTLLGTRPAIVAGRDARGALVFIFALSIERKRGARCLTWLGSALCDYNGPLLRPDFADHAGSNFPALWRQILALLRAQPDLRYDYVDLSKMLENAGRQRNPFFDLDGRPNPNGAYVATLGESWDAYYTAKRSGPTRKKERKQLKQLGEHGAVAYVAVRETGDIAVTMETLIAQKSRSFARRGVADNFARRGHREFYLDLATNPKTQGMVDVSRLDVGPAIAATSLGLRFGGSYYLVLSSYQDGDLARFGPGRAHLNELIRHAIDAKMERFDFTIGDEPYKQDWADVVVRLRDHLDAATVRGRIMVAAILGFRGLKRFIKQTPVLWQAYSRVRAFRGSLAAGRQLAVAAETDEAA